MTKCFIQFLPSLSFADFFCSCEIHQNRISRKMSYPFVSTAQIVSHSFKSTNTLTAQRIKIRNMITYMISTCFQRASVNWVSMFCQGARKYSNKFGIPNNTAMNSITFHYKVDMVTIKIPIPPTQYLTRWESRVNWIKSEHSKTLCHKCTIPKRSTDW